MTNDQPHEDQPDEYGCPLCGWSFQPVTQFDLDNRVAEHDARRHGIPKV